MWPFRRPKTVVEKPKDKAPARGFFSTDFEIPLEMDRQEVIRPSFQLTVKDHISNTAVGVDGVDFTGLKAAVTEFSQVLPDAQLYWYASQGFIGHQACAMLMQHWLIDKACSMPARDAARPGYELSVSTDATLDPKVLAFIKTKDKEFHVNENMVEFSRMSRGFGIRIALPVVDYGSEQLTKEALENPYNPDGIRPGSYKGIAQIDPYWTAPMLGQKAASDPKSIHFYEPTWWIISGQKIHRSHLIITRFGEVPDVLKPTYLYGGVPLPQRIFERVYASERTANEAPLLALTKRTTALHVDMDKVMANEKPFLEKMATWIRFRDNKGVKILGVEEKIEQFDISLSDLDAVIMTQYQLVAAIAEVPSTKLLGTTPKGFQSTGEFEMTSYHEMLSSIQEHDMTPLLNRHHELLIRSEVAEKFPQAGLFTLIATWNPLDTPTAVELAAINLQKAQTGVQLSQSGAIDGQEERERIRKDKSSGYDSLPEAVPEDAGQHEMDPGAVQQPAATPPPAKPAEGKMVGGSVK